MLIRERLPLRVIFCPVCVYILNDNRGDDNMVLFFSVFFVFHNRILFSHINMHFCMHENKQTFILSECGSNLHCNVILVGLMNYSTLPINITCINLIHARHPLIKCLAVHFYCRIFDKCLKHTPSISINAQFVHAYMECGLSEHQYWPQQYPILN